MQCRAAPKRLKPTRQFVIVKVEQIQRRAAPERFEAARQLVVVQIERAVRFWGCEIARARERVVLILGKKDRPQNLLPPL